MPPARELLARDLFTIAPAAASIGRDIARCGQRVEYMYQGQMRTGFVQFMRNGRDGKVIFGFVGTSQDGFITTIFSQRGKDLWKLLNKTAADATIYPK